MDFGISKAYRLLPHYDGRDEGNVQDAQSDAAKRKIQQWQEQLKNMSNGPRFISPDLVHLNSPPPYPYLEVLDP